jgi:putative SOS response-associated peptidase YedK
VGPRWQPPPKYAVFPDNEAPVIRKAVDSERMLEVMRWGMPGPLEFGGARPCTNIRNLKSAHWRQWMKPEYRCLVPANAFSEYTDSVPKIVNWFARDEDRTPFAFAGVWQPFTRRCGTKANPIEGDHLVFSFLTTEANDIVRPIHAKAMPVILTEDNWDIWLDGTQEEALALQQPAPNDLMRIVATGEERDPPEKIQSMN